MKPHIALHYLPINGQHLRALWAVTVYPDRHQRQYGEASRLHPTSASALNLAKMLSRVVSA